MRKERLGCQAASISISQPSGASWTKQVPAQNAAVDGPALKEPSWSRHFQLFAATSVRAYSACPIPGRKLGALAVECGEVGPEHRLEEAVLLYTGGADDFAEFNTPEGCGDDLLR